MHMKTIGRIAMLLLAPLAVACAQGEQADQGEAARQEAAGAEAAGEEATAGAGEMAMGVSVSLAPRNQSGLAGTAVLRPLTGDSVTVELSLSGLADGESYPAHVHQGTCQSPGPVAEGLESVAASGTTGRSTSRIVDPRAADPGAPFLVMAHSPDGTPAACGDVPTEREPPASSRGSGEASGGGSGGGS